MPKAEYAPAARRVDAIAEQAAKTIEAVNRIERSLDPEIDQQAYREAVERFFEDQDERTLWDVRYSYSSAEGLPGGVQLDVPHELTAEHVAKMAKLYGQLAREARVAGFYLEPTNQPGRAVFMLRPLKKERIIPDSAR